MASVSAALAAASLSNLTTRLLTAAVGLPIVLAAVWGGGPWFLAVVMAAGMAAVWEFARIARAAGARGAATALWVGGGLIFIAVPLCYYLALRAEPNGAWWVYLALLTVFANDTAAYATGRLIGRHRMTPRISPNKTWEGAVGGLVAAALTPPLVSGLIGEVMFGLLPLGIAIGVAAQAGDLIESAVKRKAGAKDAGGLVPGHGGVLDRLDSLVLAGPLVYHYAQYWLAHT
jgi:phosphatidate cytidylyltransferase